MKELVSVELISEMIFIIRGHKIMLDRDLADLYGISTKVLNQAVKRNRLRFPDDFMFRINKREKDKLVTNCDRFATLKHSSASPNVFTEQGVAMLSSVLNSERAIQVNIEIMRTFTKIRKMIESHKELLKKIEAMEKKYDKQFSIVFQAIRELMDPPEEEKKGKIGFTVEEKAGKYKLKPKKQHKKK